MQIHLDSDLTLIVIISIAAFIVVFFASDTTSYQKENYSNIQFTNYEQIPNYAMYPNSIANAYILNYQYMYPGPAYNRNDSPSCLTY